MYKAVTFKPGSKVRGWGMQISGGGIFQKKGNSKQMQRLKDKACLVFLSVAVARVEWAKDRESGRGWD